MRIIVCGLIAQYPLGGVCWDYLQYVIGLRDMGHDVFYFEDTGQWPYNPVEGGIYSGCEWNVGYLGQVMERFGLGDRWAYRMPWMNRWYGLPDDKRREVVASADVLLNISACLFDPSEYASVQHLAFIDSDPIFTQVKVLNGDGNLAVSLRQHHSLFTFGECVAAGTASLQETGIDWLPTRQPIVLDEWRSVPERRGYTTIMNWTSYGDLEYGGVTFGHKDSEFLRFIDLPARAKDLSFEIAMSIGKTRRSPQNDLRAKNWTLLDPNEACPDMDTYRDFICSSRGEWSVAKNAYVVGRSGWFSCRSACYLAAGRPVVVQSTGFEEFIPTGEGVLSFNDLESAVAGLRAVEADYDRHAKAARDIAAEFFDARKVLRDMLEAC